MNSRRRSFDHLVGLRGKTRRHVKTERLGRLEIDHQLKFSRLHYWQGISLFAVQDTARIDAACR